MHPTISRLRDAMNAHDARAMAALMSPDYRSVQPAHPNRGFGGAAQVEANWGQMFAGVPDLVVDVVSAIDDGTMTWSEWDWHGHHVDGSTFHARGVTLFGLRSDGAIISGRLYMESVEEDGAAIEETVRHLASGD
jgi:ketosteroid isomerase-like protein